MLGPLVGTRTILLTLERKRQEGDSLLTGKEEDPADTDPFRFPCHAGLSVQQESSMHCIPPPPPVARFALGQGEQALGRTGTPGTSPWAQPSFTLMGLPVQPRSSLSMLLPNTRPLLRLFQS